MEPHRDQEPLDAARVRRRVDAEIGEVRAAITLVANGTASRVTLTGFAFGDEVCAALRDEAARRGVTLVPAYGPEDAGCDIAVVAADA